MGFAVLVRARMNTTKSSGPPPRVTMSALIDWIRRDAAGRDRYLFGIVGPPGSGKSTIASTLAHELGAPIAPMDGFHLPNRVLDERGLRHVKGAPETFAAHEFADAVQQLRAATEDVLIPDFDRVDDEPRPDRIRLRSTDEIIIVEGNYLLLDRDPWSTLRDYLDAVGYVDIDSDVRIARLIARHVHFGKTPEAAAVFVHESDERNTEIIEATRQRSDLIIDGSSWEEPTEES
jgi:pantothenate kinase